MEFEITLFKEANVNMTFQSGDWKKTVEVQKMILKSDFTLQMTVDQIELPFNLNFEFGNVAYYVKIKANVYVQSTYQFDRSTLGRDSTNIAVSSQGMLNIIAWEIAEIEVIDASTDHGPVVGTLSDSVLQRAIQEAHKRFEEVVVVADISVTTIDA